MANPRSGYAFFLSLMLHGIALTTASLLIAANDGDAQEMTASTPGAEQSAGLTGDTFDIETILAGESANVGAVPQRGHSADEADFVPQPPANAIAPAAPIQPATPPQREAAVEPNTAPEPPPVAERISAPEPGADADADAQKEQEAAAARRRARRSARRHARARRRAAERRAQRTAPPTAPPSPVPSAGAGSAQNAPTPATADAAGGKEAGQHRSHGGQQYGAAGAPRGAQRLVSTFLHELPSAVAADRAWFKLQPGEVGAVDVALTIDTKGKVSIAKIASAPAPLMRIARRTVPLMRGGTFMLSNAPGRVGQEVLRISVTLTNVEPLDHPNAKPTDAFQLGNKPPAPGRPGRAYFTLASGRHFEAHVQVVSSTPAD